jgi:ABC-2 type transport system ATP-binding protein
MATLRTLDDDAAIQALSEQFGLDATLTEEAVTFYVPGGEKFVPQLFAELGVPIRNQRAARGITPAGRNP